MSKTLPALPTANGLKYLKVSRYEYKYRCRYVFIFPVFFFSLPFFFFFRTPFIDDDDGNIDDDNNSAAAYFVRQNISYSCVYIVYDRNIVLQKNTLCSVALKKH